MGAIKDIVDLLTQISNRVSDRKIAEELLKIQSLALQLQSEQADLHEKNISLREESWKLNERIQELENKLQIATTVTGSVHEGVPSCPNCSTPQKPFFMRPVLSDFVEILNAEHECPSCKYRI